MSTRVSSRGASAEQNGGSAIFLGGKRRLWRIGLAMTISLSVLSLIFFLSNSILLAEEPQVEIQKKEDRTEALVTTREMVEPELNVRWFEKPFVWGERTLVKVAQISSGAVGTASDMTVKATQTVSSFLFSRLFNTLDYKTWRR